MDPWKSISGLSQEECRASQSKKLHTFLNQYIYPFSPHYRALFDKHKINPKKIKTISDLKHIPFTSKADFVESDPKDFVLQPDADKIKKAWPLPKISQMAFQKIFRGEKYLQHNLSKEFRPVFMTFTTGTTNKPVPFFYSNYDIKNLETSGARLLGLFDVDQNQKFVNMFPYAPHLAFWQVVLGGFASCNLILSTGGGKVMGTDGNIAAIEKMRPTLILGVPSYVYHVLRTAKERGINMDYMKKIVLGASKVTTAFKIKLAQLLESMGARDVSVFGTYGFTESRAAWGECPTALDISSGYHLYSDKEIFEVIDPKTGEVKGEGEDGELVYTSLDSRASSVIRYRTGDFVKGGIVFGECPHCKRITLRISSDITRLSDVKGLNLSKVKGSLVNLGNFAAIFSELDLIEEWQIELRKKNNDAFDMDELVMYVCAKDNCVEEELRNEIVKVMSLATEVSPNEIIFVSMKEMVARLEIETANKEKRIIDNRPKA